jgi:hypothetical protein
MAQYAQFNPATASPSPVMGWYDTAVFDYPNLPPATDLLEMTVEQWDARMTGLWAVSGGTLVAYTPPTIAPDTRAAAQATLAKSDTTMHRVSEAVMLGLTTWTAADVVAWADYRRALRAMVDGAPTTAALPTRPAYPAGT